MSIFEEEILIPIKVKDNMSEVDLARVQSKYKEYMWEFLHNLNSKQTAKTYMGCLRQFFKWSNKNFELPIVTKDGIDFGDIDTKIIVAYRSYLQFKGGRNNSPAAPLTIIKKLAALQSFFDFLVEKDVVKHNPVSRVRRPRGEVIKETEDLDDSHVRELFAILQKSKSQAAPLHRAVIYTLFCTGIRSAALRALKLGDFKTNGKLYYFEYFDKGRKKHKSPIHEIASIEIQRYIKWMKSIGREIAQDEPLFQPYRNNSDPTNLKKELNASGVSYILDYYVKQLNICKRITVHSARATLIGSLLASGKDLYKVSSDINHASVNTTARYDKRKRELSETTFF